MWESPSASLAPGVGSMWAMHVPGIVIVNEHAGEPDQRPALSTDQPHDEILHVGADRLAAGADAVDHSAQERGASEHGPYKSEAHHASLPRRCDPRVLVHGHIRRGRMPSARG
jgi:6-phosphofructokinase